MPFVLLLLSFLPLSAQAEEPDWSDYAAVLRTHVHAGRRHGIEAHLVDYPALARDPAFRRALARVEGYPTTRLATAEERLAYYLNAYNLFALRLVADHWPLDSIRDLGHWFRSVWDMEAGHIDGRTVSLGEIEHQILRRMGEPRIHLALVCASLSCPDLRREPYRADRLDAQLNDQTRRFLANPAKGLRLEGGIARVSAIFAWFEADFSARGGVVAFVHRHRPEARFTELRADLPYDWSVNGKD